MKRQLLMALSFVAILGIGVSVMAQKTVKLPFDHPFISLAFQHQQELDLSAEQLKSLEHLRSEYRIEIAKRNADLHLTEIELNELQAKEKMDLAKIEAKVKHLENLVAEMRLATIRTLEKGKAVLTSQQRKKLEPFGRIASVIPSQGYFSEFDFRQQILADLEGRFKDQKVVEIETTQAIVARLFEWAKYLGFIMGIPIVLLGLVLGILGIRTYSDFSRLIKTTQQDIAQSLEQAQRQAKVIKEEGDRLTEEYQKLRTQLGDVGALAQDVRSLETKVKQIEEQIAFKPSDALTPELQRELESSFYSFQRYLQTLGFKPKEGRVTVHIDPKLNTAYYEPSRNLIVVGEPLAGDKDIIFREYAHHVLISLAKANFDSLGQPEMAIESALADYFPCSFNDDPVLGEIAAPVVFKVQYIRNLQNERKFSEVSPDTSYQHVGEIWGGAFWQIRQLLGQAKADKLLFLAWISLRPGEAGGDIFQDFVKVVLEKDRSLEDGKHADQIRSIFEQRGLNL